MTGGRAEGFPKATVLFFQISKNCSNEVKKERHLTLKRGSTKQKNLKTSSPSMKRRHKKLRPRWVCLLAEQACKQAEVTTAGMKFTEALLETSALSTGSCQSAGKTPNLLEVYRQTSPTGKKGDGLGKSLLIFLSIRISS